MPTAIEFNNISKLYRLGLVSTGTLAHDLKRWWTINVLRKEDPYLQIGEANDRSTKGESDYVWALKDIDFKVEQGDVVGIIGKNGAGKSTLLKILSKITSPTTGTIKANGRIGSLLEVGTGFHPEMTGRENIYLNGAILGMTKQDITNKLDEIVDFSGCERFIDTPVKRYSSGMMVRLGFAVAAHLDPEILVVDEVLAVGDAEFQKKAIGKMQDVSKGEGRTVLFVSHNMASIRALCKTGVLLENGMVRATGRINNVVEAYLNSGQIEMSEIVHAVRMYDKSLHINHISFNGSMNNKTTIVSNQEYLDVVIEGETSKCLKNTDVQILFKNREETPMAILCEGHYKGVTEDIPIGKFRVEKRIILPRYLGQGDYKIDIAMHEPMVRWLFYAENAVYVHVDGGLDGVGQAMNMKSGGIIGLETIKGL
jgi:lipopolysaccharide transport system ATP-binding protein